LDINLKYIARACLQKHERSLLLDGTCILKGLFNCIGEVGRHCFEHRGRSFIVKARETIRTILP